MSDQFPPLPPYPVPPLPPVPIPPLPRAAEQIWTPRIEAVTICVDYADFLTWTIPLNRTQFDNWIVVTKSSDKATIRLCDYYNVRCITTDVFYTNGRKFNKGAAVNVGLAELKRDGFVVQLDADMLLPPRGKEMMQRALVDPTCIYGVDRFDVNSFHELIEHFSAPEPQLQQDTFIVDHSWLRLGHRLMHADGWVPIGFFQAWCPNVSGIREYITEPNTVLDGSDHGDVTFAHQWPRAKRHLIPEFFLYHLRSDENSCNWQGRISRPFK